MRKKISKFLLMVLVPVVMFMTAGILSFSNISGAYSSARALSGNGGVVYVGANSTFNMTSGGMSGSKATNGGAVCVAPNGTFNMSGGSIYSNIATNNGNNINNAGTFTMTGGTVGGKTIYTRVDENNKENALGDYILFGSYPKTIKADGITINERDIDDYGYYLGSDGARYAKVKAAPRMNTYVYSDGTTIVKDVEYYFKVEPIKWRILSESNGEAILLAEDVLNANIPFYNTSSKRTINEETIYANNYEYSTIRAWLNSYNGTKYSVTDYSSFSAGDYQNNGFYNQAFSQREKDIILTSVVNNSKITTDSSSNPYESNNTNDKIWMLSYKDAINSIYGFGTSAFNYEKTRKKLATDYALANNVYLDDSNGYWKLRSPDTSYDVSWCVRGSGQIYGAYVTFTGAGVAPALKINLNASTYVNDDITSGYSIYNTGTMNLYGGNVYDSIYSSSNINTKMAANIAGKIYLGNSATITVEDYAGTTPNYTINLSNTRTAGTILTFVGSSTEPDLSKLNITGFDTDSYKLKTEKNSSGNWTVVLYSYAMSFPKDWKTQVASTTYMTTTLTPANLTSIKFVSSVPSGYTKIGTLSTGLPVYQGTTATEIAFVAEKIYAPENSSGLFSSLSKLTIIDTTVFDTSKVIDMSRMFIYCSSLTNLDVSDFNTLNVTNMYAMFHTCSKLTDLDLSNFNTLNVVNMSYMFNNCSNLTDLDLRSFNTSNVTNMSRMFNECSSLPSLILSSFVTSNVTNMSGMFYRCLGLTSLDLRNFNTSNVTDMSKMFSMWLKGTNKLANIDVSNFDTSKVTDMSNMFEDCSSLTSIDISKFNTQNVTNMSRMFYDCSGLESLSVSNFDTSKVTDMSNMFDGCSSLTSLDVSNFNTSNVTAMKYMFAYCSGITSLDVSNFDTAKVTDMSSMFFSCRGLTSLDVSNFVTTKVTDMSGMFSSCSGITSLDVSNFDTTKVTNMSGMFFICSNLTNLDLSNFNTSNVTNMYQMFIHCSGLTSLDLRSFDTSNVTDMRYMFEHCSGLESLDLSNFVTSKVTDMTNMFAYCSGLTSLDVSNFNTSNVSNMQRMFSSCSGLTSLDLSSFNMSKVTSYSRMFNFGSSNKIETLKTPYNNTAELPITTGSTLYNADSGAVVTSVPANTTKSLTYVNYVAKANLPSTWKDEVVSSDYMSTVIDFIDLRSVKFVNSLSDGYSKIGTLSTGLAVYATSDLSGIAFVVNKIYAPADSTGLFRGLEYITELNMNTLDTSLVTNMNYMFYLVKNVEVLDVSNFNTSKVTNMGGMFESCGSVKDLLLSNFDTSNVTNMSSMFLGCSSLTSLDLSNFNTSKVTNMGAMFGSCTALTELDLSNFNTEQVTSLSNMFSYCNALKNLDISSFDTSKVTNASAMFQATRSIVSLDLTNFNWTSLSSTSSMFATMPALKYLDISNMNLSKVTSYSDMLNFGNNYIETFKTPYGCQYDLAITSGSKLYNVETNERVTTISANTASSMTLVNIIQNIDLPSDWQTQVASATYYMKEAVTVANLTSVKFVSTVPAGYTKIGELLNNLPVYANADRTAIAFVAGKKITAPADSTELFYNLTSVTSFDFEVFDTSSVTDMTRMFMNCNKLVDVDFATFNTSNVTKMYYMFRSCSSLVTLDLSSFNTAKVQDMNSMFSVCGSLVSLNVSSFDTSKVNDMTSMFSSCSKLVNISLANFNTCNVSAMDSMFFSCSSLVNLDLSNFDTTNLYSVSYMFSYCAGLKTLDLSSFNLTKVSQYIGMLNFSENNHIETFKTPYGCKAALAITSGSTLYNESGVVVSTILANASASMTLSSTPSPVTFPTDWKTQLTGSTMTTTIVAGDLTSIAFERSVPTGYTQIGTIATSILVYKSTSVDTDIVFVYAGKIKAPVDSSNLFKGLTNLVNLTFNNFDTSDTTTMLRMFTLAKNSSRGFTTNAVAEVEKFDTFNTTLENLDLSMFDTSKVVSMAEMFYGCVGIKTLDCSSFDMSNVANWTSMFNFTKDNKIETLKLPYNNTGAIPITTGSELFGDTADQVTLIPANNVKGKVLGTKVSIHFVFTQRNFGVDTPAGIAEIKSGSSSVQVLKVRRGMSWEEICDEYNLVAVGQTLSGENMTTAQLKENAYKWWTIFGEVEGTEKNPIFRKGGTVSEIGVDGFKIEFFYDSMYCLSVDTEIDVYDEKRKKRIRKKLKDISYKDKLLVWNFDKGCFDLATPLFITKPQTTTRYTMVWFSDGSSLRLVGADDTRRHRVFCLETGKFEYVGNGAKVGMTTYNDKGEFVKITKIEFINEKIEFMNIITSEHFNCFANGILTSCKLSNMYPIKNMKYDKTNKTLNTREMFEDISDFYYKALRLAEQPLLNTYNDHSEYIDYKQIYEIEWENSSFKRNEK